jgi:hypothetical protein
MNSFTPDGFEAHVRTLVGERRLSERAAEETLDAFHAYMSGEAFRGRPEARRRALFLLGKISEEEFARPLHIFVDRAGWAFGAFVATVPFILIAVPLTAWGSRLPGVLLGTATMTSLFCLVVGKILWSRFMWRWYFIPRVRALRPSML